MMISAVKAILRTIRLKQQRARDGFLGEISGVIHVGANTGQELDLYEYYHLKVIWIEPIPEVFATLTRNIQGFRDQLAFQQLVTDRDGKEYSFHIANNNGASSSILSMKHHKNIWPEVNFSRTTLLKSTTLPSLLESEHIEVSAYQALVIDTQGSELLVLNGCIPILHIFKYIKTEVPDFEAYQGCCQLVDIHSFMDQHGFRELSRRKLAGRAGVGNYFDVIYERVASR